ncbi:MAG: M23 family metallopeptidase [Bacteroidales bacterium]|nr:M23 family metallopeptidase [Bacteroidales bacterium]
MKKDWFKINKMQLTMIVIYTVLLIAATSCIIIFTPIREYIPGYTDVRLNYRVFDIEQKADSLESVLHQNDVYIRNLKHIINDEDFDDDYIPINIYMDEAPVFMAPLNGMITNRFNYNNKHYGIDIVADIDEVIKTMWNGTVVFADWSAEGGYTIGIQHDKNIFSVYKHNAELLCHEGDIVQTGDPIAIIGNGGSTSTGPHLHFEFWFKGMPLNPEDYITFERK